MNRFIIIVCALLLTSCLWSEEQKVTLLVSVQRITSAEQSFNQKVQIHFRVHEPIEIRGTGFISNIDSTSREEVRNEYPVSGLFTASVPDEFLDQLKTQIESKKSIQSAVDAGIDPRRISTAVMMPIVEFSLIKDSIREYRTGAQPVDTANASNAASFNLNQSARIR